MQLEELDENPFWITLKTSYKPIYETIFDKRLLVCIPQSKSLKGIKMTKELIETHVFRASPYLVGQFESLNGKVIEIEGNILKTQENFKENRKVKVLFEELNYNQRYESFVVMCIESTLEGKCEETNNVPTKDIGTIDFSVSSHISFLETFEENIPVLKEVDKMIVEFQKTYVLVKGFLRDTKLKVQIIFDYATKLFTGKNENFRDLYTSHNTQKFLLQVISK